MKKFIILSTLLLITTFLSGQDLTKNTAETKTKNHGIGLAFGINTGKVKDTNFSPLHYDEFGQVSKLNYEFKKPNSRNLFYTNLSFSNGSAKTTASDSLESRYIYGDIELGYYRQLNTKNDKMKFYLGGKYHLDFSEIIFNNVFESFTFNIAHQFELSTRLDYQLNEKHAFSTNLSLPVLSLLVRPPYSGYDEELNENTEKPLKLITNGDFVSIDKHRALKFELIHKYQMNERLGTQIRYEFHTQTNNQFKQFQNQFSVGLNYKF